MYEITHGDRACETIEGSLFLLKVLPFYIFKNKLHYNLCLQQKI